ncbi:putative hydrolase of the HAD superfamily [Rhizobiales bacterium GAS191]|nr:putative hydrolase of the HAD superfamily [Rhizobiales bacterium GAS191]
MLPVSAVLFDMNEVLCHYDKAARVKSLAHASGQGPSLIEAAIWEAGYEDLGDSGAIDAEEYLRGFGQRIGYALSLQEWVAALRAAVTPIPDALALAARIGREARIAVLTNNNLLVAREIDAVFPELRSVFSDTIFVSAEFHARKPDPEVYLRCVARLGVSPQATLFVDDSPLNVAGAEQARLQAHCYTNAKSLAEALAGYGLLRQT